jgi:DNA-binding MarR family transcriptional regulator
LLVLIGRTGSKKEESCPRAIRDIELGQGFLPSIAYADRQCSFVLHLGNGGQRKFRECLHFASSSSLMNYIPSRTILTKGQQMDMRAAPIKQSFTDEEKVEARVLLTALEPFRQIRKTMPLQYVVAFLLSVIEEGEGITALADKAGVTQSVMSRHILDIGPRNRYGSGEGFDLVTTRMDPMEMRRHQVLLTNKGRALYQQIMRAMYWRKRTQAPL